MKVLMFGWEFPPLLSGGLGTACYGLTKELANLGVEIKMVLPKNMDQSHHSHLKLIGPQSLSVSEQEEFEEEQYEHISKRFMVDTIINPYMNEDTYEEYMERVAVAEKKRREKKDSLSLDMDLSGNYGHNLFSEVLRFSSIGKVLGEKEDFDVIHAHDWLTFLAGIEAKRVSNKPLIIHVHATEYDRSGDNVSQEIYDIERYGMLEADKIVAVSHRTKNMIVEKYHIDPEKIEVVYNGVEQVTAVPYNRERRPFKGDKMVLFLGRITHQKGPHYFLDAANLVLKKMPNVRFVMAGAGDMTRQMIEKIASMKLAERFHFTGFLNPTEREKAFAMSDLYVMPSVSEPFGITPLEAMKYNVPIIISKQSGIAEILHHALKVDFWDVEKLAAGIISLLEDKAMGESMGRNNKKFLNEVGWHVPAEQIRRIYSDMTN